MELNNRDKAEELIKINPIVQKLTGKTTYLLWEDEEEKEMVLKYIYDYCENNNYDKEKIYELSIWSGIKYQNVEEYAKYYALDYLGYSVEEYIKRKNEYRKIRDQKKQDTKELYYPRIYSQLLNATTLEEIINILSKPGIKLSTISTFKDYVNRHHNGDSKTKEELKSKIKMYTDYILEKKKKELEDAKVKEKKDKLPLAIEMTTKFINDTECYTIDYFCDKYSFDKKIFEENIALIREYKIDLYNIYENKINDIRSQRYAIIISQIKYIIEKIKHGIEEYGINRPFDIIDYYSSINISIENLLRVGKDIVSPSEFNILKKFINQNINGAKHDPKVISQIMSEKVIIKYEKDSRGNPIPGTEEPFSNEEKEKLINYLREKNIPINLKTYNTLYRRYRNGTIDINQKEMLKR